MWKKRTFTEDHAHRMDRLLKYLWNQEISYTFHTDNNSVGDQVFVVFWFE